MRRYKYRRQRLLTRILTSGKTYLLLAGGFAGFCVYVGNQELMPGWHAIFGKPSTFDNVIVGIGAFLFALLVLAVVRRLLTYFLQ